VALDSSGNLYIADNGNNRVQRWAPGATGGVTVAGGNGQGIAANQLSLPHGVALDEDGNVYVTDCLNSRVQR
jgi:DNA-binding beta-propeller fold protein YncE